ncbi:hypothetical protein WN943_018484 [Citrus x changshan-huyou]
MLLDILIIVLFMNLPISAFEIDWKTNSEDTSDLSNLNEGTALAMHKVAAMDEQLLSVPAKHGTRRKSEVGLVFHFAIERKLGKQWRSSRGSGLRNQDGLNFFEVKKFAQFELAWSKADPKFRSSVLSERTGEIYDGNWLHVAQTYGQEGCQCPDILQTKYDKRLQYTLFPSALPHLLCFFTSLWRLILEGAAVNDQSLGKDSSKRYIVGTGARRSSPPRNSTRSYGGTPSTETNLL